MAETGLLKELRDLLDEWDCGEHDDASFAAAAEAIVGRHVLHFFQTRYGPCAQCFTNHYPHVAIGSPCACACHKTTGDPRSPMTQESDDREADRLSRPLRDDPPTDRPHINAAGEFQSDKYPMCPPGKVPLSVNDLTAQDLLWEYAQRRRAVDVTFADDLEHALRQAGYDPVVTLTTRAVASAVDAALGEVIRQAGYLGHIPAEARGVGIAAAGIYLDEIRRRHAE